MSFLFVDSTYDLNLGVLNDAFNWLSFEVHTGSQKASAVIQTRVHEILSIHQIDPKELQGIIIVNGPGFYTGVRLAEGFSDVFSFFGVKQYSFYSFEIPKFCGYESGSWFTKAYRGEYFFYHWDENSSGQELLASQQIENGFKGNQIFIHSPAALDVLSSGLISSPIETTVLLKNYPEKIFSSIIRSNSKRESFYFRAPEDEFKLNP